ncbi:MAG: hypothetical protein A2138_13405 [Deltaproteobacteria bacterium RBG_16_71_12]|nr:MAG: hypothetical protein A2138_13405 [Deltaproteobacteria bacterium RBG_16_71_12]
MGYLDTLGRVMKGDFGAASDEEKAAAAHEVIQVCAVAAAAVTIQPFPVADVLLLSPIQIGMVQAIGRIHGRTLDKKTVLEILSTVGASILAQNVIMAAAKLIPVLGSVVAMSMGYALTYAIGEVSDLYFKHGSALSSSELKSRFRSIYETKKKEKEHAAKDPKLKEKLDALNKAFEAGVLSKEEFEAKKEEVLKGF